MSSFFTRPASQRKRKATDTHSTSASKKRNTTTATTRSVTRPKRQDRDESVSGSDYDDNVSIASGAEVSDHVSEDSSEAEDETAAEKRLRLAERYLENIRDEVDEAGFDAADIDRDIIASRLREDVAESKGKVYRSIANDYDFEAAAHMFFRANHKSLTGIATHAPYVYTVSSDMVVMKWEIPESRTSSDTEVSSGETHKNPKVHPRRKPIQRFWVRGKRSKRRDPKYIGHTASILCVACSPDGKFLATGGADNRLVIWDAVTMKPLKLFSQHRDSVMSVAFRRGTNQLFSASADRTVKVWSLDELAYVETLFGHQDHIPDVDALGEEKCVTVGSRDRTARLWKVVEESQLVFRGGGDKPRGKSKNKSKDLGDSEQPFYAEQTIDRISLISNDTFITGSANGSLSLWSIHKKKPISVYPLAHGLDPPPNPEDLTAEADEQLREKVAEQVKPQPRWITALKAVPYSDLIFSASWDGRIRAWKVVDSDGGKGKSIEPAGVLGKIDLPMGGSDSDEHVVTGVINDLAVFERGKRGKEGLCVVAAVGQEHRLGRWTSVKGGRNAAVMFEVKTKEGNRDIEGQGKDEDEEADQFASFSD